MEKLIVSTSPHIQTKDTTQSIMRDVPPWRISTDESHLSGFGMLPPHPIRHTSSMRYPPFDLFTVDFTDRKFIRDKPGTRSTPLQGDGTVPKSPQASFYRCMR